MEPSLQVNHTLVTAYWCWQSSRATRVFSVACQYAYQIGILESEEQPALRMHESWLWRGMVVTLTLSRGQTCIFIRIPAMPLLGELAVLQAGVIGTEEGI